MSFPDMPEVVLRRIWREQRFTTEQLATADGRAVAILSPGTPNTDGGPDFLNAKIQIGRTTFHGDVELHINAEEWRAHKHDSDPHYNKVILHVVLTADVLTAPARTASRRNIPLLVLHSFVDEKLRRPWMDASAAGQSERSDLACKEANREVSDKIILSWLDRLAQERMELKVRRYEERLKQLVDEARHIVSEPYPRYHGNPDEIPAPRKEYTRRSFSGKSLWEQLLYEGVMEAMGYSKNQQPFLELARSLCLSSLRQHDDAETRMALLFGAAGLLPLPNKIPDTIARDYVARMRRIWNTLRKDLSVTCLSEGDWLFFRLRPSNFPTARLAAVSFLLPKLFGDRSFHKLVAVLKDSSLTPKARLAALHQLFAFEPDDFWRTRYHFKQKTREKSASPSGIRLGEGRINDIIVNMIAPVALLYARIFRVASIGKNIRTLLSAMPASQENSITDVIQTQLAGERFKLSSALLQQGAIELYRMYCVPIRCNECAIGRKTITW